MSKVRRTIRHAVRDLRGEIREEVDELAQLDPAARRRLLRRAARAAGLVITLLLPRIDEEQLFALLEDLMEAVFEPPEGGSTGSREQVSIGQ